MSEAESVGGVVRRLFAEGLKAQGVRRDGPLEDTLVLLQSGLDSLGFARLVTRLEMELGYDPFLLSEEPLYPRTLGEFVSAYEKFGHMRQG